MRSWKIGCRGGTTWRGTECEEDGGSETSSGRGAGLISDPFRVGHADCGALSSAGQRASIHKVVCTSLPHPLVFCPGGSAPSVTSKRLKPRKPAFSSVIKEMIQRAICSDEVDGNESAFFSPGAEEELF